MLDQASDVYTVGQLRQDIGDMLQAEGYSLKAASQIILEDV